MKYLLYASTEHLLKEKLYVDFNGEEKVYYFEEGQGSFDSKVYFLNYENKFIFLFERTGYDEWELNFKTIWLGTNSDNYHIGGIAINFLGQMIKRKIITFDSEVEK